MDAKGGVVLLCVLSGIGLNPAVVQQFLINQIVPDVIDVAPRIELSVAFTIFFICKFLSHLI